MPKSIDIIIPSFRAKKEYILPILNLNQPEDTVIRFYLVIDNPSLSVDKEIINKIDNNHFNLILNSQNLGASLTRNVGINAGKGEWILFLDDDIEVTPDLLSIYTSAIDKHPTEIGFIGLVTLPDVTTDFTKATLTSGSAGIFTVAEETDYFAWGATANIMISRSALGEVRFSEDYPKSGGGEDVDFFLRVRKANHYQNFKTLKEAQVWHPWWDEGRPNFKRAFRYGQGTGYLIRLNPEYTRYDFPSTPETLFFSGIALLISLVLNSSWSAPIALFILGTILIDIIASFINSVRKANGITVKILYYMITMKLSYDYGVLSTNISKGFFNGLLKRFNYNGDLKKDHFIRFNRYKIVKIILCILLIVLLFSFYN